MATIHLERLQQLALADRPALGAFAAQVAVAREAARWAMQMSLSDYVARRGALTSLVIVHEATRCGRRLDLVAVDLRHLADELDGALQLRVGGCAVGEAA